MSALRRTSYIISKMSKRYKPNQRKARKVFTATAMKTNPKNTAPAPMRGGYRL